ncbi:MalY/PatB family protein [Lentibacillus sp. N15]|uniref:MalY/PatB family protein n=1 Tax=Lentibacillus songyuanensis TaxID=3136161 RepID=UPI0031B9FED9
MGNFDLIHNRKQTRSVKWDTAEHLFQSKDVLPMWVADMDFKAPQEVLQAIMDRTEHGIFGYTVVDEAVRGAIVNWVAKRHHWHIEPSYLSFSQGVVASLHMAVQAFTEPNDKILIQTPVYTPFYNVIKQHDRQVVKNPLLLKDNYYTIDFNDFEEKLKSGVKAFILCSPHNPVGRVWKESELREMARLCLKYDVLILSDEIHADLLYPGYQHTPMASLSKEIADQTVTFMSPSKTFNLAGLQASYIITSNEEKRKKLDHMIGIQGHGQLNTLGNTALEAAYNHGEAWLEELKGVLEANCNYVTDMFVKHAPELTVIQPEGTYLLWIDCSALNLDSDALKKFMSEQAKVGLNAGAAYGEEGEPFMRMNIACPKATVETGVKRIIEAIKNR